MKKAINLLIIGVILMLAVVGCSGTNTQSTPQPSQNQYVGGGCGVAPTDDSGDIEQLPMEREL